jgi:uncharacterized membrane protein YfcA
MIAAYYYFRFERQNGSEGVPLGIAALVIQTALVSALSSVRQEALLPTVFTFLIILLSIVMVQVGLHDRSKSGFRIALAGFLTGCAYLLAISTAYHAFLNL